MVHLNLQQTKGMPVRDRQIWITREGLPQYGQCLLVTKSVQIINKNEFPTLIWTQIITDQPPKQLQTAITEFQYRQLHQL